MGGQEPTCCCPHLCSCAWLPALSNQPAVPKMPTKNQPIELPGIIIQHQAAHHQANDGSHRAHRSSHQTNDGSHQANGSHQAKSSNRADGSLRANNGSHWANKDSQPFDLSTLLAGDGFFSLVDLIGLAPLASRALSAGDSIFSFVCVIDLALLALRASSAALALVPLTSSTLLASDDLFSLVDLN